MRVEPLHEKFGARVLDVDRTRDRTEAMAREIVVTQIRVDELLQVQ